jgi:hypothetical protein
MCYNLDAADRIHVVKSSEDTNRSFQEDRKVNTSRLTSCSKEEIQSIPFDWGDVLRESEPRATTKVDEQFDEHDTHFVVFVR